MESGGLGSLVAHPVTSVRVDVSLRESKRTQQCFADTMGNEDHQETAPALVLRNPGKTKSSQSDVVCRYK